MPALALKPAAQSSDAQETRLRLIKLLRQLDSEYATWRPTQESIVNFIQPNRGAFTQAETNKGIRKDGEVVNNTASDCSRKLTAAIDTGGQSEAREWFTLSPEDPQDAENPGVREYLHVVQAILFALIARSSYYTASRNVIEDLVGPATGLMTIEEDDTDVFRCTHHPVGSYRVWADCKGDVAGFAETYTFTASQMGEEFGEENCSPAVREALARDLTQAAKFTILHVVEKRTKRQRGKIDSKSKPWASYWLELSGGYSMAAAIDINSIGNLDDPLGPQGLLRESGHDEQPFVAPRWNALGQDAYGKDSPGWNGLGDTKALQAMEIGSAKGVALMFQPPMGIPPGLKGVSLLPGALWQRPDNSKDVVAPILSIPPSAITVARDEKQDLAQRINRTFYGDVLFLISSAEQNSRQPDTAEATRAKVQERLLQLGGVFSRYAGEHMKPSIARMFAIAQRKGMFPPPPEELLKTGRIRVDFQNPLVTAQKTVGFQGMQQLVSFSIGCAQAKAAGVDKIDFDEMLDTAADMLGVKPNLLKDDQQLTQERQAQAQAAQAKQTGEAMTQAAPAIKDLSSADPEKLQQLLGMLGGNAQAQGVASA